MESHTIVGDQLSFLTSGELYQQNMVTKNMKLYALEENKGKQLWFRCDDGTHKKVEWSETKILEFCKCRRKAEGNTRF